MCARLVLLLAGTVAPSVAQLTAGQRVEVFDAVWKAVSERFYDARFRGAGWAALEGPQRERFRRARSDAELEQLIRGLLGTLRNSHLGFTSRQDRRLRRGVLPFLFERAGGRVFVTESRSELLQPGDEILGVEGRTAASLTRPQPRYLQPLEVNPYFGEVGSLAGLEVASGETRAKVRVNRVARGEECEGWRLERLKEDVGCLRLRRLPQGEALAKLLEECRSLRALILDLRNCSGGVLESSLPLASFLLGPGRDFYLHRPRVWTQTRIYDANPPRTAEVEPWVAQGIAVQFRTYDYGARFRGPVAALVNEYTASEAELIVAALQDHQRARVFGQRTNGAVNGWSVATDLPYDFGSVAIPYTSARPPLGRDLEGMGVDPDERVTNQPSDLRARRDQVLGRAADSLRSSAPPR